ncbi:MAG: GNAT family N-acetyltransferase [Myxococcota bacterium]
MPAVVEPLGPSHVAALRALLSRDPTHNMYLLGLMEEFGVVSGPKRAPFTFYGRFFDEELTAALFVGGNGGLLVPSASSPIHIGDIAKKLVGLVQLQSVIGEQSVVDSLLRHFAAAPKFSKLQKLFSVSPNDLGPFTNPLLRLATDADVPRLVPMAAACVKEMMQRDPLVEDPVGFELRVKQRVRSQRTYVLEEKGQLVFKLDVGSRSQFGAELEGLYTHPEHRNRGHATLCLGQISRFLMSSLPRLTVRIDDDSTHFANIARKVGYLQGRTQKLAWL